MIQHDARCDRDHTPRQRCNRRMTLADARVARLATEAPAEGLAPTIEVRANEPEVYAVCEAVATIEAPEPTGFASREWNAAAVAFSRPASGLVAAALGFGLLLIVMRRRT